MRWGGAVAGMRNVNPRLLYWRTPSPVGSVWEAYGALRRWSLAAGSMLLSAGFGELQHCLLLFSLHFLCMDEDVSGQLPAPALMLSLSVAMLFPP